jgi:hypothetical protein
MPESGLSANTDDVMQSAWCRRTKRPAGYPAGRFVRWIDNYASMLDAGVVFFDLERIVAECVRIGIGALFLI